MFFILSKYYLGNGFQEITFLGSSHIQSLPSVLVICINSLLILVCVIFSDFFFFFLVGIDSIEGYKCGHITTDACYVPADCDSRCRPQYGFSTGTCVVFDGLHIPSSGCCCVNHKKDLSSHGSLVPLPSPP
jgi:hypothetical protein